MADELEAPDAIITLPSEVTQEQADELRERFKAHFDGAADPRRGM